MAQNLCISNRMAIYNRNQFDHSVLRHLNDLNVPKAAVRLSVKISIVMVLFAAQYTLVVPATTRPSSGTSDPRYLINT